MASMYAEDKERFAAACRVDPEEDLPENVEKAYWEFKKGRDPLDASPLRVEEIALVVYLSGHYKGQNFRGDERPPLHIELIKLGEVREDAPISIRWVLGKPRIGKFKSYAAAREMVVVQFDEDVKPREFPLDRILGLPEAEALVEV
jgi:hypothetical protein